MERACDTLLMCIVTVMNHGLRNGGGVGDILRKPSKDVSALPCPQPAPSRSAAVVSKRPASGTRPGLLRPSVSIPPADFQGRCSDLPLPPTSPQTKERPWQPALAPGLRGVSQAGAPRLQAGQEAESAHEVASGSGVGLRQRQSQDVGRHPGACLALPGQAWGPGAQPRCLAPQESLFPARVVYDLLFFFIVIIIVLNLIFGVIIDTFADLRSEKQKKEEILKTTCFICGEARVLRLLWALQAGTSPEHGVTVPALGVVEGSGKGPQRPPLLTAGRRDSKLLPLGWGK